MALVMSWFRRSKDLPEGETSVSYFGWDATVRPFNIAIAKSYVEDFMALEAAGESGDFSAISRVPTDITLMMELYPEGYEFYRHSMYAYLDSHLGLNSWAAILRSLWRRLELVDPEGSSKFLREAWKAGNRFSSQRANAKHSLPPVIEDDVDERDARRILAGYAAVYEIDVPIWFLGVLGKAFKTSRFNPELFGGPESDVPQSALIQSVMEILEGTPIFAPFTDAYDAQLRNSVNHNDYTLVRTKSGLEVVDRKTQQTWSFSEVVTRLSDTWSVMQAIEHCVQYMEIVAKASALRNYVDLGVTDIRFLLLNDGRPSVLMTQLWCFRDLDPLGRWLDESSLTIRASDGGAERIGFTENAALEGEAMSSSEWGQAVSEWGWVHVRRVPVAPDLGFGFPCLQRPDGTWMEIRGDVDEHIVRYAGN